MMNVEEENSTEIQSPNSETAENNEKNPIEELSSKLESLEKTIEKNRNDQKSQQQLIEEIRENQKLILEKLDKTKKEESEAEAEKKPSFNSVISPGFLKTDAPSTRISPIGRSFVLKHTFKEVSKFEEEKDHFSEIEDHFGVSSWCLSISKEAQHLQPFICCKKSLENGNWAIDTKFTFRVAGANHKITIQECNGVFGNVGGNKRFFARGSPKFMPWEELKENWLVDDKLAVEAHVEILEMSGVYKENLRCFDETRKKYSDVVLKVNSQKFYVAKLFLASHSPYFDSLFLGPYLESNQSEIELSGIYPEDFQNYLEVLYGDPAIDDTTVEGILLVADMYDTSIVIGKCIDFLVKQSKKSVKKKLQMAIRYNSDQLRKTLISNMKTLADIRKVNPENPDDLDHATMAELLNKSLALREKVLT